MGRKSTKAFIGIDVGGTKILSALVTSSGKVLARTRGATPRKTKPKKVIAAIFESIENLVQESGMAFSGIQAVGIAIPGVVDPDRGKILVTPNMSLSGIDIIKPLQKYCRVPVSLGNDVNLGILGEHWLGAARNVQDVIGVFVGTGIGGGIIHNNVLFCGIHNAAAEIGHMIMKIDGPRCGCGNRGCLEALSGRSGIERQIRAAIKAGRKTVLTKLLDNDLSVIKSKVLRKALNKRDPLTKEIMSIASTYLGFACISIKHLFDPAMIVLGGGLIEACGDFILPIVQKSVAKDPFLAKKTSCRVVPALLGDDAVVIGAVALAKQKFV